MMKKSLVYCILSIATACTANKAQAQILSKIKSALSSATTNDSAGSNSSLSTTITQAQASSGLKEALSNGLNLSIETLSQKNGFLGDAAVKILMSTEAQKIEKTLRAVGMGSLCDQFIQSMNHAAESAVKEAAPVFVSALSKMSITDAYNILLSGKQDAATTFFKTNTSTELTTKFSPVIESAMGTNQVNQYWNQLTTAYNKLPLSNKVETNLTAYVTQKAIDGLFIKVADQELKIRENVGGARSTDLLSTVFGWADSQK